ncbi:MAG TPA: outer membrane lipoprotein carrier protein LolA [Xanthomonadaceae bacterium]|nr:outer membrane lipoprotein carrier protein LolA [Xanthomonadaceae bacterium]
MIRSILIAMALLLSLPCFAAEGDGIRDRLAKPAVLRGKFEQARHLQGFRNALSSQGDFVVVRERGVIWETRKPFPSTTVISKSRLLTRQADGSTEIVFDKSHSPAAGIINALMLALLGGDLDVLSKYFTLKESTLPEGAWRVELTPRKSALAHVFERIVLQGDRYVRSVHLEEKGGDVTDIVFQSMVEAPDELEPSEARQFE